MPTEELDYVLLLGGITAVVCFGYWIYYHWRLYRLTSGGRISGARKPKVPFIIPADDKSSPIDIGSLFAKKRNDIK